MAKTGKKKKKWGIIIFFLLVVLLFIGIYIVPEVTGILKTTVILEYESLPVSNAVTCYFVRDESVFLANATGQINYHIKEGEKIRKGVKVLDISAGSASETRPEGVTAIMQRVQNINGGDSLFSNDLKKIDREITSLQEKLVQLQENGQKTDIEETQNIIQKLQEKRVAIAATEESVQKEIANETVGLGGYGITPENYVSPLNSVVSYYIDGYEQEFTPENMVLLSKQKLETLQYDVQNVKRDTTVANEPLYKLVDNSRWYVLFWVGSDNIAKYQVGNTAELSLPLGKVPGKIESITDDNGEWQVVIVFDQYYEDFAKLRKVEAQVITSDEKGLIVPNESIATEKKQVGVYVKNVKGDYIFTPIKIITTDGEYSVVVASTYYEDGKEVNTVDVYDEILKRPN